MKLNKMSIWLFILSFHIILNESEQIKNFDDIFIPAKTLKEYKYNFKELTIQDGKDAYFFFKLSNNYRITLTVIDEDKIETPITIYSYSKFYFYKIENIKSQQYTFLINNSHTSRVRLIFIDNSREINIKLENLLNLSFDTELIEDKPPLPLIFNMDSLDEKTFILFETKQETDAIYDGNSRLEYCELNERECNFKSNNEAYIFFEKGKKYKIKYNCNQRGNATYLFEKYQITSFALEVDFGFYEFLLNNDFKKAYYILNIKNYEKENFYIYANMTNKKFKGAFITEEEKNEFIENKINFNSFDYISIDILSFQQMNNEKDYLIIFVEYSSTVKGFFYFFSYLYDIQYDEEFEIEKETYALIRKKSDDDNHHSYILASSNKNMGFLNSTLNIALTNIISLNDYYYDYLIYIKSSEVKTYFKYYYGYLYNTVFEQNLTNYYFNKYGPDSFFMRTSFDENDFSYKDLYFFGLDEKYYFFNKIYFGKSNFYEYNKELNWSNDILQLQSSTHSPNSLLEYDLVNNKLLIVSGYQLFILFNKYISLYDLYFQKVNDLEHIQINSEMFQYNNLIKLLIENKTYYLDFYVDHLIKLDKDFLEAKVTFTDINGKEHILNKENKVIRDLKGEGIFVKTNKKALLYFYKKMDNITEKGMVEFNISQIGKNMKFNITSKKTNRLNIYIVEDFGFKGYYPMLRKEKFCNIDTFFTKQNYAIIFVDNFYDKLENNELYEDEGEKYFVYIFDSEIGNLPKFNIENYILSEPFYSDNLLSSGNNNDLQIIPGNSTGSIVLNLGRGDIYFQFYICKNEEIKFTAENLNGNFFFENAYPYRQIIEEDKELNLYSTSEEMFSLSFESNNEFIFSFHFNRNSCSKSKDFSIISIFGLSRNFIEIKFSPIYTRCNIQYYIIITKKDNINNYETFSDQCYLLKLFKQNSVNSILIKSFYYDKSDLDFIVNIVDISQLNVNLNSELVANIISYKDIYEIYEPLEFKLKIKNAYKFQLEETVEFNVENNNLFKFDYKHESDLPQLIYFSFDYLDIYNDLFIIISDTIKTTIYTHKSYNRNEIEKISFNKSGTYYVEFYSPKIKYQDLIDNAFIAFIAEILVDSIDLSKKMYYKNSKVKTKSYVGPDIYKVKNIKKETYAFFSFNIENEDSKKFKNPFQICNINKNECENNITLYKFVEGNEYNISINFTQKKEKAKNDKYDYFYPSYLFFPLSENISEEKEEGIYNIIEPQLYVVNLKNKDNLTLYHESLNHMLISYSKDKNFLNNLNDLNWKESSNIESIYEKEGYNYVIILISPNMNNNNGKFVIANQLIYNDNQEEFNISSGKNGIIIFETQNNFDFYNILTMFYSEEKNMILINSANSTEYSDFISQNSYPFPIYIDKPENDIKIKIKTYKPKYANFGVIHNNFVYSYMSLFPFLSELLNKNDLIQISPEQLFPLNIRINTDISMFYDFINYYFYKSENNINIYIKKFYGESDFYVCDADLIDKDDLSIITKPISFCKNKMSILNKIYNFQNKKIITGYIGHNSFLDIYLELDNNKNIKLSPLMKNTMNFTSKYLKKDEEYTIDFHVEHLIKLDPDFSAEISIYDDLGNNFIINSENPTLELKGNNFKVKSNNKAIIYFYGKLKNELKQIKIQSKVGKNIEINVGWLKQYIIDFGFGGYNPMDISNLYTSSSYNDKIYIENIYDKLRTKLVKGEALYLWYKNTFGDIPLISYNETNINSPKNEYTFIVIPKNDENSTLIINNIKMNQIIYNINFCNSPHNVKMFYLSEASSYEKSFEFNSEIMTKKESISKNFKLRFESKEDFVFSYSFIDDEDKLFNKNNEWINQRIEMTNLTIKEVNKTDNSSNFVSIQFYPNYKESSTRYIIVIAPKKGNYSKENLSNPCFITRLVTEKIEGILIINIADTGEDDLINIDVNISELFIYEKREFIINIISQELRFEKKLNFYTPFEFSINNGDNDDGDSDDIDDSDNIDGSDDKKGLSTLHIILISVCGFIFISAILFFILRYCRKKDKIDFERQTENIHNEKLMSDI